MSWLVQHWHVQYWAYRLLFGLLGKYLLSLQILKGIKDCYFGTFALDLFDHPIWTIKNILSCP